MYSWIKDMKINNYIDLLNEVAESHDYSKYAVCDEKLIENQLLDNMRYVKYLEEFRVALFVERNVCHKSAFFNHKTDVFSLLFKIYNLIFFHALIIDSRNCLPIDLKSEKEVIQNSFELACSYFSIVVNKGIEKFDKESVDKYFDKAREVSCMSGDMNSYQVKQRDLSIFLQEKGWTKESLFQRGIEILLSQGYMNREDMVFKALWNTALKYNLADSKDDILMLDRLAFRGLSNKFQHLIEIFDTRNSKNPFDIENEFIVAYNAKDFIYISKFGMEVMQEMVENFVTWEQYENLVQYFFDFKRDEELLANYNKLMTYKIADLLFINEYILPFEKTKINGQVLQIPRIEIANYIDKEESRKLGDIDVLFYSPHTNILYIIEYKNYQMYVTGNQKIYSDLSKIERENTISKVERRKKYVFQHKKEILKGMFPSFIQDVDCKVIALILTTKPNFYFFVKGNKNDDYISMEWIEFKDKVEHHQL